MTKSLVAALLAALVPAAGNAMAAVDIGDSQALDALQVRNPAHYEKVLRILRVAGDVSCETLPQMLKVYDARNVACSGALVLTSYPAKRHLSFKLDETVYAGNVVLQGKPATLRYLTRP